jgi:hypothetical protein
MNSLIHHSQSKEWEARAAAMVAVAAKQAAAEALAAAAAGGEAEEEQEVQELRAEMERAREEVGGLAKAVARLVEEVRLRWCWL